MKIEKEPKEYMDVCPNCNGDGWYSGSEAGHGCDGTDESCQRECPIEIQIQVECEVCGGTGRLEFTEVCKIEEITT